MAFRHIDKMMLCRETVAKSLLYLNRHLIYPLLIGGRNSSVRI
jgi:hypothetical protein